MRSRKMRWGVLVAASSGLLFLSACVIVDTLLRLFNLASLAA
jgi:hypothetical protein